MGAEEETEEIKRLVASLRAEGGPMGEVVAQLAELAVEYKTELERLKVVVADHKAASEDHYTAGYKAAQSLNLQREEAAYDKGYDSGWDARDAMAGEEKARAETDGFVKGVTKALEQRSSSYLRN